jgi:hypothetical protein
MGIANKFWLFVNCFFKNMQNEIYLFIKVAQVHLDIFVCGLCKMVQQHIFDFDRNFKAYLSSNDVGGED